jgi:hypothetical protein
MTNGFWSLEQLIGVLSSLVCLGAMGALASLFWRGMRTLHRRTSREIDELVKRLRRLETRLDGIENARGPSPSRPGSLLIRAHAPGADDLPVRPTLIAVPDLAVESQPSEDQLEGELAQRNAEVWSLAASEVSPEEIARRTGQPIGQVELIVGLYRRLHPPRGQTAHARTQ